MENQRDRQRECMRQIREECKSKRANRRYAHARGSESLAQFSRLQKSASICSLLSRIKCDKNFPTSTLLEPFIK